MVFSVRQCGDYCGVPLHTCMSLGTAWGPGAPTAVPPDLWRAGRQSARCQGFVCITDAQAGEVLASPDPTCAGG